MLPHIALYYVPGITVILILPDAAIEAISIYTGGVDVAKAAVTAACNFNNGILLLVTALFYNIKVLVVISHAVQCFLCPPVITFRRFIPYACAIALLYGVVKTG